MIDINILQKSGFFETVIIKKGCFLFREGDIQEYLYVIQDGSMSVEKNTLLEKKTKKLAIIETQSVIGEGTICHNFPKEVSIIALTDTILLKIHSKKSFPQFVSSYPTESFDILKSIIEITNARLLRANREITANSEVVNSINNMKGIKMQDVFELLNKFQKILGCDFLLFLEKNTALETYYTLKYNTERYGKLEDTIIERKTKKLKISDLKKLKIPLGNFQIIETIGNPSNDLGYLVLCNSIKKPKEEDQKILFSMAQNFSGVVQQKKLEEEEKNKNYIAKNNKIR